MRDKYWLVLQTGEKWMSRNPSKKKCIREVISSSIQRRSRKWRMKYIVSFVGRDWRKEINSAQNVEAIPSIPHDIGDMWFKLPMFS